VYPLRRGRQENILKSELLQTTEYWRQEEARGAHPAAGACSMKSEGTGPGVGVQGQAIDLLVPVS
jgi:hypothetical protein